MMEEDFKDAKLLRYSIIVSLIGILLLFMIMYSAVIPSKVIANINQSDIGKKIKITGTIDSIRYSSDNKTTFMEISHKCAINAVSFSKIDLNNGSIISLEGKVQEYQGRLSIIADKVYLQNVK
jgi:hypothetical protein